MRSLTDGAEPLIGRDGELSRLAGWVHDVAAGRGCAVLVDGEPGIGKSALVRAACAVAADAGCQVYWGAGDELGQALPLLPLLDALRITAATPDPRRGAIAGLLRGESAAGQGTDLAAAAGEQLLALVEELCHAGPVVLVVDELQWADRTTVAVWSRLARSVRQLPLLLVGVQRPVPRRDDLRALRRVVGPTERLRLGRLTEPAVLELVATLAGGKPGARLEALADGAAGNPLYLNELLGALRRSSCLDVDDAGIAELTGGPAPDSLPEAIADRLGFLPESARATLRAAALLGVAFSVTDLATVTGSALAGLLPALDEARAAGVLVAAGDDLAFRHPLIRDALYDELPPAVRVAWHEAAARALAGAGAPVERVARQLLPAVSTTDSADPAPGWVVRWLLDAAAPLIGQAPAVAVTLLRRAVRDTPPGDAEAGVLSCRLAGALYRVGDIAEAERVACHALTWIGDADLLVDLHTTVTQCRGMAGRSAESLAALHEAATRPGLPARHRARLLVLTARAHRDLGEVDTASRVAAAALAEAAGDRWATGWALHVRSLVAMMRGEWTEALPLFERAMATADGDPALTDLGLLLRINQAVTLGALDRYPEALAAAGRARELADRTGSVVRLTQAQSALGQLLLGSGRWDGALAEVDVVPDDLKDPSVVCCDRGVAAIIQFHRGETAAAQRHLDVAAPYAERIGDRLVESLAQARSLAFEHAGAPDRALAALTAGLTGQDEGEDLLGDAVRLAVTIGDTEAAARIEARVRAIVAGSAVPHRGALARYCRGLLERDAETLLHAADGYRDAGRPLPRAKALEAAAAAFAEAGDRGSARAAFTRALDLYTGLDAQWDVARLRARFRAFGIRRGPTVKHRRATYGWDSLTPTEGRIAGLVVEGLTNPQIAARLFLSPRTVATHVSHILAKLGVHSRIDIAREAARHPASG